MKKFVVIDHSLSSLQGHHYECSISLAEAAARVGYQPIIIANKVLPESLTLGEIPIIRAFEVDWFNNSTLVDTTEGQPEKSTLERNKNFQKILFHQQYIWKNKYPKFLLFFEKIEGSSQRLVQWIKDDVKLLRSIPLSNTLWGIFKIVWGLVYFIFKIGFESIKKIEVIRKQSSEVTIKKFQSFTETLAEILPSLNLTSEDQILIHTFGIEQLEELYYFLEKGDHSSLPTYHLLFRRDTDDSLVKNATGMGLKFCLRSCYESKLWPDKIRFYTDTEDLVSKYNALTLVQVSQVPIPFRQEKLKLEQTQKDFIHLVYLGDARSEKGYQHLPQLVSGLWQDYLRTEKVRFTIQSNYNVQGGEAQILEAKLNLCQYPTTKIRLIDAPMSPEHYYQLLASADIVILPYNPQNYQRTSGVLTEALAAGKPVVVPNNSWLAQQVDETRASIYESPQDLTQAVIRLLEDLPRFSQNAQEFSVNWRSRQSSDYFLQCLLKPVVWKSKEVDLDLFTADRIVINILLMLDGSLILRGENLDILTYFNQCGYQVYGIFYFLEQPFDVHELRQQLDYYRLQKFWILSDKSESINFQDFSPEEYQKYLDNRYHQRSNLRQNWMEASRLLIPNELIKVLQFLPIDLIYIDSFFCGQYLKKIGLNSQKTILDVSRLYTYEQAIRDNKETNTHELNWEIEQLNAYPFLVTASEPFAERLGELTDNPQIYAFGNPTDKNSLNFSSLNQVCQMILGDKACPVESLKSSPKIAILYPWGDLLERKSGASQRTGHLIDFLQEHGLDVRAFSIGERPRQWHQDVYYENYLPQSDQTPLVRQIYQDALQSWHQSWTSRSSDSPGLTIPELGIENLADSWLPWIYYSFRYDPKFKQWLEDITDWADGVILEYPFWAAIAGPVCQQKQKPLILTAHDVLAKQLDPGSWLNQIALYEELHALEQANAVITLSPADQAFFHDYGIESHCVPIGIDLDKIQRRRSASPALNPEKLGSLERNEQKPFCLFVGSQHQPNIDAVQAIRRWSDGSNLPWDYMVVGSCWRAESQGNFFSLGKVSEDTLSFLYQRAFLVVIPLEFGTGMSVKTIEAMAYGKVILGTQVAFRGYPVQSGVNCLICDNLDDYPEQIRQISQQMEIHQKISLNAQKFAQNYDYRQLYKTYLDLIYENFNCRF